MCNNQIEQLIVKGELPIKSKLTTLEKIVDNHNFYSIPLYQRLYVWGDDQVTTLLEDLEKAVQNPNKFYFLGGIMVTKANADFDLIDGQQRFTTLWLLGFELKNELEAFIYSTENKEHRKRLSFAIRDFANMYFENPKSLEKMSEDEKLQLHKITQAQQTIRDYLNKEDAHRGDNAIFKKKLAEFIFKYVAFIETEMPADIDENRLFEALNNRGVQLQHHEIIKSKLLAILPKAEIKKYAQIWDACSIMEEYIEKNIKEACGFKWGEITQREPEDEIEVGLPNDILDRINSNMEDGTKLHLLDVLKIEKKESKLPDDDFDYDSGKVRSIISFAMFIQHTLRIFTFNNKYDGFSEDKIPEVNEKKLIEIFENYFEPYYFNEGSVKKFILLLWELRIKFDNHVIKWIEKEQNTEVHLIKKLYQNKKVLQRKEPISNEGFALLQSMLYHSQQITTLYWLTPFLHKTLSEDNKDNLYSYLRNLDNKMFCSEMSEDLSLRSWRLVGDDLSAIKYNIDALNKPDGTSFWSYWFYKSDFILWYLIGNTKDNDWKNYRMTKKNSVEHISPQKQREYDINILWDDSENLTDEEKKNRLNDYGNLVLLSVGMNSEYSNKTFLEKRTTFIEKKRLDSLKSSLIFENINWNWKLCQEHKKQMLKYFDDYFKSSMDNQVVEYS